jgi:Fe-S oxidoreductase/nitrate reductase gamma subunit
MTTTTQQAPRLILNKHALRDFFVQVIGQERVLNKWYPGVMHFLIFWGVVVQVIGTAINLMQMKLFLPFALETFPRMGWYLGYEMAMDVAGLFIILGVLMAGFRRLVLRPKELQTNWDDWFALAMLLLITLIGFANEAMRLMVVNPPWAAWSPIGNWLAGVFLAGGMTTQQAFEWHNTLVVVHVIVALVLVAAVPFTKLRHMLTGPLNILVRPPGPMGALQKIEDMETTELLGVGKIVEFTPQQLLSFDACLKCGRCQEACPASISGMDYSPRDLVQMMRKGMNNALLTGDAKPEDDLLGNVVPENYSWQCTTCGACIIKCPVFINPVDEVIDLRRFQALTSGKLPKPISDLLRNFERQANPWGIPPDQKMEWAEGLNVRELAAGDQVDVLYFVGCAAALDQRNKKVAKAFVKLLQKAGVDFGVLGLDEMCCGETARRMGHEYMFQEFAKQNIETFSKIKFSRIVTACPHCFNTLKNEYPQMGGDYKVMHYTELLAELKLPVPGSNANGVQGKVSYHDSCYLGRYNEIYKEPRALLDKAGVQRVEMARKMEDSLCCGGGGGGMWLETDISTRINHRRLQDALDAKADVVATACPYCMIMFEDAIKSKALNEKVKTMDIAEVLAAQLEL